MAGPGSILHPRPSADGAERGPAAGGNEGPGDPAPARPRRRRRPHRRRRLAVGAAALAAVAAVAAAGGVVASRGDGSGDRAPGPGAAATAPVEVRTLSQTEQVDGTLDFGDARGVTAGAAGTVTALADDGSTVDRGDALFAIDQHPTVLLTGAVPLYRDLEAGVDDGADVRQLEENLAALGHTDGGALVVDEHFDGATAAAVAAWQEARGVEVTGAVTRADAVFLPGRSRVAGAAVDVGATVQEGATVIACTGQERVVRVPVEPAQADTVHVGDEVTVTLPDGAEVGGTVATVAETSSSATGGDAAAGSATGSGASGSAESGAREDDAALEATITLADQAPAEGYTSAGVEVELTGRRREDALAVPVTALVALAGTGYAVEVVQDDGTVELVPVNAGMYAEGYVEVSGHGLEEGMDVVVAEP